jgi:hypothetical protein
MITNLTIVIKTTDTTITLDVTTRTQKAPSPMTRRMIASAITSRKKETRPCIMTSPLSQALAICSKKEVNLIQDLLHTLNLGLALAQAVRATTTIILIKMIASRAQPPSASTRTPLRVTMADTFIALTKVILFLPPSRSKGKEEAHPEIGNCTSRET